MSDANQPIEGEIVKHELQVILDEQGVSPEGQKTLVEAFGGPFNEVGEILANFSKDDEGNLVVGDDVVRVTDVDQIEDMIKAKEQRLMLKHARTTVERKRKELKEDSLKTGRAIDAVARFVRETIEPAENYLEEQEKFKELKEKAEAAERLAARTSAIAQFTDPEMYNLATMPEDQFQDLLIKLDKERADQLEAERKAEEEKLAAEKAERERQAKIAEENKRLHREAEEREAANQRKLDRVNQLVQQGMTWDQETEAYQAYDVVVFAKEIVELNEVKWKVRVGDVISTIQNYRKADHERAVAEQAERDAERKRNEELERQAADRKAAEEKAAADRAAAERQALLAPDKEKISAISPKLEALKLDLPATKDKAAQEIVANVYDMIEKITVYIETNVEKL